MSKKTNRNRRRRNAAVNRIAGHLDRRYGFRRYGLLDALDELGGREGYRDLKTFDITKVRFDPVFCRRFPYIIGNYFFATFKAAEAFRRTNHFFWDNVELSDEMGVIGMDLAYDTDFVAFSLMTLAGLGAKRHQVLIDDRRY